MQKKWTLPGKQVRYVGMILNWLEIVGFAFKWILYKEFAGYNSRAVVIEVEIR